MSNLLSPTSHTPKASPAQLIVTSSPLPSYSASPPSAASQHLTLALQSSSSSQQQQQQQQHNQQQPSWLQVSGESYASERVLDLRRQKYNDLNVLNGKFPGKIHDSQPSAYPWTILLLSSNLLSNLIPLSMCHSLRKLDLANNELVHIPKGSVWRHLQHLQILYLHNNKLDSIHALQQLSVLPSLLILTCFANPVEHHPAYRHVIVNSIINLKLFDFFIVSDEELIENANFGPKFGRYSDNLKMNILNYEKLNSNESSQLIIFKKQLDLVIERHRHFSPILKLQSFFRGVIVRRTIKIYHLAAACIQGIFRKYSARKHLMMDKPTKREIMNTSGNQLIFLVKTNDICVSLFMQLIKRVEMSESVFSSPLRDASMLLLSPPSIHDDYPLVRRIYPRARRVGWHMLPGRDCPHNIRSSLAALKPRTAGRVLTDHQRFLLNTSINTFAHNNQFLVFQAPGPHFYELLIRAVHQYNIEMGHYQQRDTDDKSLDKDGKEVVAHKKNAAPESSPFANSHPVIIYPGTTVAVIAAAVSIQSVWRAYSTRKHIQPPIGVQLAQIRGAIAIQRWWRQCMFSLRMHLLCGLKRYADSINSRHLFARGDILTLLRHTPNSFVDRDFWPEHRAVFGVEGAGNDDDEQGKMTIIVDHNTPVRFYPVPQWLCRSAPLPILPVAHVGVRIDMSCRLLELLRLGVSVSLLPEVGKEPQPDNQPAEWNPNTFVKFSFASVEEARNRAIALVINTWLPSFHLDLHYIRHHQRPGFPSNYRLSGSDVAFLLTPQHMQMCLQHQHANNKQSVLAGPNGERHIMYSQYWLQYSQKHWRTIVKSHDSQNLTYNNYSNEKYLDLKQQLKQIEDQHLANERREQQLLALAQLPPAQVMTATRELELDGAPAISTYQPTPYQLKKDMAESERLISRRLVAQSRIEQHTKKLENQQKAREITVLHRIRMDTVAEREAEARQIRQLAYESMGAAAKAAKFKFKQQKHAYVHQLKHENARRAKLRQIDSELDAKGLRKRVEVERLVVDQSLQQREALEQEKREHVKMKRFEDNQRHRRLLEEKDNTMSFLSQQNMISRQLTSGMMKRLKHHQQNSTIVTVQARREMSHVRRHEVHQILFENFNRRRQAALAQQMEIKQHVQFRKVKDHNKVELLRARRQHISYVREMASAAAMNALQYPADTPPPRTAPSLPAIHAHAHRQQQQSRPSSSSPSIAPFQTDTSRSVVMHSNVFPLPSAGNLTYEHDQLRLQMDVLKNLSEKVQLQYASSRAAKEAHDDMSAARTSSTRSSHQRPSNAPSAKSTGAASTAAAASHASTLKPMQHQPHSPSSPSTPSASSQMSTPRSFSTVSSPSNSNFTTPSTTYRTSLSSARTNQTQSQASTQRSFQ